MLLREGLDGRAEIAIGTLIISGLRRHMLDLLTSFCTFATNWLREISCGASQTSGLTPIGNGTTEWPYTISPMALSLTRQRLRESMSGCHSLLLDLANHERGKFKSGHIYPRVFERRGASRQSDPCRSRMPPRGAPGHPLLYGLAGGGPTDCCLNVC